MSLQENQGLRLSDKDLLEETRQKMKISEDEFNARYQKVRKLGEGTQSSVFLYRDVIDGKEVAVKILSSAIQEDYENFRNEIEILQKIQNCQNVIRIYHYVLEEEKDFYKLFMVMELAVESLEDQIKLRVREQRYFTQEQLFQLTCDLCTQLYYLHNQLNLAHRDIKPQNVLYCRDGRYKITDFGVSKRYTLTDLTYTKTMVGTMHYFSPQLRKVYENFEQLNTQQTQPNLEEENLDVRPKASDEDLQELVLQNRTSQQSRQTPPQMDSVDSSMDWDYFKNDVFSLGLTLLRAAVLKSIAGCNIHSEKLTRLLQQLKKSKYD